MIFRKSIKNDINNIMNIINQAKNYFSLNHINQWQNNYPNYNTIYNDINNHEGYVLCYNNIIIATVTLSFNEEETYKLIYNGSWLSNNTYAVIHRIAIDDHLKGKNISSIIINNIENICRLNNIYNIRVDTHKDNISMQKMLTKNKFEYCGIIYLNDKSERIAFEKVLI